VSSASTRERLRAAAGAGTLPTSDARTLEAAFDLLTDLKLDHQVAQVQAEEPPDDYLDPASLDQLTRSYLREAFRAVAKVQRRIASDVDLGVR